MASKEYQRAWYLANREREKALALERYYRNHDRLKAQHREYMSGQQKECTVHFCSNRVRLAAVTCRDCNNFTRWLLSKRAVRSDEVLRVMLAASLDDKVTYLTLRTRRQAQGLRKRLFRKLQKQFDKP